RSTTLPTAWPTSSSTGSAWPASRPSPRTPVVPTAPPTPPRVGGPVPKAADAMNDHDYTEIYRAFVQAVWAEVEPMAPAVEETGRIPYDRLFPVLRRIRAFGLLIPERYGGLGLTVSQYLPLIAELAKSQGGVRALVHVHNSMGHARAADRAAARDHGLPGWGARPARLRGRHRRRRLPPRRGGPRPGPDGGGARDQPGLRRRQLPRDGRAGPRALPGVRHRARHL